MKNLFKCVLCAVCAAVLLNCSPTNTQNYIVINKTKSYIGVIVDYYTIVTIVEPNPFSAFEHYEKATSHRPYIADFKLSNLDDTISIRVSGQTLIQIREGELKTKTDTILYRAFSYYGRYTSQWVITDELFSIMTPDPSLLTEFPDFYAK